MNDKDMSFIRDTHTHTLTHVLQFKPESKEKEQAVPTIAVFPDESSSHIVTFSSSTWMQNE